MKRPSLSSLSLVASVALISSSLLFLSSCSKDDAKKSVVDISDPNAVAKSLTVENATYITGNPPATSTSETAPALDGSNLDPLVTIQGSKIIVSPNLTKGTAAGFYVKIKDSNGYFKVASTTATGRLATKSSHRKGAFSTGRLQSDEAPNFSIEVPGNIKPGEFCISYCVYDADNQVSNVVTQCITVKELGGTSASSFLTSQEWAYYSSVDYENNQVVRGDTVGSWPVTDHYQTYISCGDSSKYVDVYESYKINYEYVTFDSKGALGLDWDEEDQTLDYEHSNCDPVYIKTTDKSTYVGAWSYDDATKLLTLLYNDEGDDSNYETNAEQYEVSLADGNLILKITESPGTFEVVTLKPKK